MKQEQLVAKELDEQVSGPLRLALIEHGWKRGIETVRAYLPANYVADYATDCGTILIQGHDNSGWTLDEYVIPRLASGLIVAREIR